MYQFASNLDGNASPINALAFDATGALLAGGGRSSCPARLGLSADLPEGDDEQVRIWDTNTYECIHTLADSNQRWGQITTVKIVDLDMNGSVWLMFGTARGRLGVFQLNRTAVNYPSPLFDALLTLPHVHSALSPIVVSGRFLGQAIV